METPDEERSGPNLLMRLTKTGVLSSREGLFKTAVTYLQRKETCQPKKGFHQWNTLNWNKWDYVFAKRRFFKLDHVFAKKYFPPKHPDQ